MSRAPARSGWSEPYPGLLDLPALGGAASPIAARPAADQIATNRAIVLCGHATDRRGIAWPLVWVADPVTEVVLPYRAGTAVLDWLQAAPDAGRPDDVLDDLLLASGILIHTPSAARGRRRWRSTLAAEASRFQRVGYAVLRGLVAPLQLAALRRHYRDLLARGGATSGDLQCPHRGVAHNETVARLLQDRLTPLVSRLAGTPVKPSYAYLAAYRPGAELARHVDRAQCEYSISLSIDHTPDPQGPAPWPLYLETAERVATVRLGLGDAVFYRGRRLPHFRTRLANAHHATLVLLHFVDAAFPGPLD